MFNYLIEAPGHETRGTENMTSSQVEPLRRRPDGALDIAYYRERAGRLRNEAMRHALSRLSRRGLLVTKRIFLTALAAPKTAR